MARDPNSNLFNVMLVPALILGGLILIALAVLAFGDKLAGDGGAPSGAGEERRISGQLLERFENDYDAKGVSTGEANAPVVVREFADYQCPACAAFADTAKRLREDYVAAGKVRFVFFDFPLPMHDHAREAAAAARCADRSDNFWGYHDRLFDTQREWARKSDPTDFFYDLAVRTGIPLEPFQRCLSQGATEAVVQENAAIARDVGAAATPTVLVGDRLFSGVTDYATLKREIDNQLANAGGDQ